MLVDCRLQKQCASKYFEPANFLWVLARFANSKVLESVRHCFGAASAHAPSNFDYQRRHHERSYRVPVSCVSILTPQFSVTQNIFPVPTIQLVSRATVQRQSKQVGSRTDDCTVVRTDVKQSLTLVAVRQL